MTYPLHKTVVSAGVMLAVTASGALAQEFEFSGFVAGELRVYPDGPAHEGQSGAHLNPSLIVQPEFRYEMNDGDDRLTFIPYARLDSIDDERSHWDIREANWLHLGDDWDIKIGADKVFWGVAESRHLVDILNQTDLVEDLDGEDKLGQPMVNLGLQRDWGFLNIYAMPYFRERTFPGRDGRLRGAVPVDDGLTTYDSGAEEWHPDIAIRYSTVIDDFDIGLSHFHGTSREPTFSLVTKSDGSTVLAPHYDLIDQTGLDVQATLGDWLWKLEAITRSGQGDRFIAAVGGFEYTVYGVNDTDADLGLLMEYQYDGRDDDAPVTIQDNDIFFGSRLTLNDVDDTDFLAGFSVDHETGSTFFSVEADTRLSDFWTVELEARAFAFTSEDDPVDAYRQDHHLQLRLSRYF